MKKAEITNVENAISNLESLSACLLEGEDYCSVAVVEGAILEMRNLLNASHRDRDAIRAFIDSSRKREAPFVVTEQQLYSLAYWITKEVLGNDKARCDEIIPLIPFLKKRVPEVLGVVIDETQ